jgi:hypothetical protein
MCYHTVLVLPLTISPKAQQVTFIASAQLHLHLRTGHTQQHPIAGLYPTESAAANQYYISTMQIAALETAARCGWMGAKSGTSRIAIDGCEKPHDGQPAQFH